MIFRFLLCGLLASGLATCDSKKKDKKDAAQMKDQSGDTSFQGFVGRLQIAVARKDYAMLASMMSPDFGYRWDTAPPGESPFDYWDKNNLWPELSRVLGERFVPNELSMAAPPQLVSDPTYKGPRVGLRVINGSWRFYYFLPGAEPEGKPAPASSPLPQ